MKAKEVFLIFVAFTLLFILFCVVTLTGRDSDKCVHQPTCQLSNGSGATGTNRNFIHRSINKFDKTADTLETKSISQIAPNHPSNRRTGALFSNDRVRNANIKDLLKPIESNGRVYLENTTGIEVCENDIDDEGDIETIE
jgi:hypothetical protein